MVDINIYKMEEWKIIFEEYEISNLGNCRKKGKVINGSIQNRGYKYFQVQREGKRINKLFHHLVAEAFIGKRPDGLVIDHIDQDKLNNKVDNLRYVTQKINTQNQTRYRDDIETKDKKERRRIMSQEYDRRTGRFKGTIRQKGTGNLVQRENGNWRAILKKDKKKCYDKTFKTKEEAEDFMKNYKEENI
jgi:hypothetical protein